MGQVHDGVSMSTALARASDADFELITDWHIAADIYAVWQALNHPDYSPRWWPYVRALRTLAGPVMPRDAGAS